jgi:hypothetical protein
MLNKTGKMLHISMQDNVPEQIKKKLLYPLWNVGEYVKHSLRLDVTEKVLGC